MSERYARQTILPEIGPEGQARLAETRLVVAGAGALGSYLGQILARAGVGRIRIVDRDVVERSNLQRQVLFTDADAEAGIAKAVAAERALTAINPDIEVDGVVDDLNAISAHELLAGADLVLDGTDNLEARYLINDWTVREGVPWVYAGVIGTEGLVMPVLPGETACLRCVFEEPPGAGRLPTCETAGVLGSAVAVVAGLAATEGLKLALGRRDAVRRALLTYDAWKGTLGAVATGTPRPDCPTCGRGNLEWLGGRRGSLAARLCGRNAIQLLPRGGAPPALETIAGRLGDGWEVTLRPELLRARRGEVTLHVFHDGRTIVDGITDEADARGLVARVVGA